MSTNLVNKETGELITLASGTRVWIGTQSAHDLAVQHGTMPNNCMVCITDDMPDADATDDYSTEETKTYSKYIDGKPIYRKVFSYTTISDNQIIDFTVNNIDTIVDRYGSVSCPRTPGEPINFPIPYTLIDGNGSRYYAYTYVQGNLLRLTLNSDTEPNYFPAGSKVSLIIEYTKTTD